MSLFDSFSSLADFVTGISPVGRTPPLPQVRLGELVAQGYRTGGNEPVSLVTIVVNLGR
jgi:hypothetical protein